VPNLPAVLRHFPGQKILIIGDVILDRYWWGEASRLSPEAPVPVVRKQRSTVRPGGAANTAANLATLGATAHLVGLVGIDREAGELQEALLECGVAVEFLITEDARPTTTKTRVIASHQQIVRVDDEDVGAMNGEVEDRARGTRCWPHSRWRFPRAPPIAMPWSWPPKLLPLRSAPWVPRR
jgi:D-beta-D-heptose 7-phosphate kinase/D-beta-D-heptose 1-phosphate adenosyltransferase